MMRGDVAFNWCVGRLFTSLIGGEFLRLEGMDKNKGI